MFTSTNHAVAYAAIDIVAPADTAAVLRVGSDDRLKVWVNGLQIWSWAEDRPLRMDQDVVPIELRRGRNRMLFKVTQTRGDWELLARLTDANAKPLTELRYQMPREGPGTD